MSYHIHLSTSKSEKTKFKICLQRYDVPHDSARLDLTPPVEVLPWGSLAMDALPWS
jgi:hypothetical protein